MLLPVVHLVLKKDIANENSIFIMRVSSFSSFSSPWPDPNSPVLSKIDFGVPLVELFKWLEVRDTLLGDNRKKQDITAALALARDCKHPDAVWLTSVLDGKYGLTKEKVREVFLSCENDARALCFGWWLTGDRWNNVVPLVRAADLGYGFACSCLCDAVRAEENQNLAFCLAQRAAAQHERDGYFWSGIFARDGSCGCEQNFASARVNLSIAAELGGVVAACNFGHLLEETLVASSVSRWLWWSRAASHGLTSWFLVNFPEHVHNFISGCGSALAMFAIGRSLYGNVSIEKREIFGARVHNFDSLISPANQAVSFYESQIKFARLAVGTWTLVSTRLHLMKDMRILISKMIWEARFEANYKTSLDANPSCISSSPTFLSSSASSPVLEKSRK